MKLPRTVGILSLLMLCLCGCANLQPGYRQPEVKVTGLSLLPPGEGEMAPRLGVQLVVTNPGSVDLSVKGMSYSIALDSYRLLSGVSAQVPLFKAYSETPLELSLSADMLQMLKMARSLAARPNWRSPLNYEFTAELDIGTLAPPIRLNESGTVNIEDFTAPR